MTDELRETLQQKYPAFYQGLLMHNLPHDFKPDRERTREAMSMMSRTQCRTCDKMEAEMRCTGCGVARYCNTVCQAQDWTNHKQYCSFDRIIYQALKDSLNNGHVDE